MLRNLCEHIFGQKLVLYTVLYPITIRARELRPAVSTLHVMDGEKKADC